MPETEDGFIVARVFSNSDSYDGGDGVRATRGVDGTTGKPIDQWTFQIRHRGNIYSATLGPDEMREAHVQGLGGVATYTPDGSQHVR